MDEKHYDRSFFEVRRRGVQVSAEVISGWVYELLAPKSVIDVGCGTGGWLSAFRRYGVANVLGLDGAWVPLDRLEIPAEQFRAVDLRQPLAVNSRFDLAISLEVAEHLSGDHAKQFVRSLTGLSPVVLFSAAIPQQGGTGHLNEQWPAYWIALFREQEYECVDCLRGHFWQDDRVAWWYAQNAFFFVAKDAAAPLARLEAERLRSSFNGCAVVHPFLFEGKTRETSNRDDYQLRTMLKVLPRELVRAVRGRLGL